MQCRVAQLGVPPGRDGDYLGLGGETLRARSGERAVVTPGLAGTTVPRELDRPGDQSHLHHTLTTTSHNCPPQTDTGEN